MSHRGTVHSHCSEVIQLFLCLHARILMDFNVLFFMSFFSWVLPQPQPAHTWHCLHSKIHSNTPVRSLYFSHAFHWGTVSAERCGCFLGPRGPHGNASERAFGFGSWCWGHFNVILRQKKQYGLMHSVKNKTKWSIMYKTCMYKGP